MSLTASPDVDETPSVTEDDDTWCGPDESSWRWSSRLRRFSIGNRNAEPIHVGSVSFIAPISIRNLWHVEKSRPAVDSSRQSAVGSPTFRNGHPISDATIIFLYILYMISWKVIPSSVVSGQWSRFAFAVGCSLFTVHTLADPVSAVRAVRRSHTHCSLW